MQAPAPHDIQRPRGLPDASADAGGPEIAHLLRRAGFGATRDECEFALSCGYRATVERLLSPGPDDPAQHLLVERYFPAVTSAHEAAMAAPLWAWRLVTTRDPLKEKLALFWHGLFATAFKMGSYGVDQIGQIELFREHGLGRFEELLVRLSQDPAMLVWLDNAVSTASALNENYGRELLELFSMGIGNYSEDDVQATARAFTGWTVRPAPPAFLHGPRATWFEYHADDHDVSSATLLGESGQLNGHRAAAIIAAHPATARFIARRLAQFFMSDQVSDSLVETLTGTFLATGGHIQAVLRELFCAPEFLDPAVRLTKVKSPVELVFGLARLTRRWSLPDHAITELVAAAGLMGQTLLAPPNVGGWPSGTNWLHGSALLERVNYASQAVDAADPTLLGQLDKAAAAGPDQLVDACLRALDLAELPSRTRLALVERAEQTAPDDRTRTGLKLIVATPEFQYC